MCDSSANPGVTEMTGELQVSGLEETIDPDRTYTVAGTDWELEPYGGMAEPGWGLEIRYDFPTIVREAIEEHLAAEGAVLGSEAV